MSKDYAIYLETHGNGKSYLGVLLTDGAWTAEHNCLMREFGVTWHKPRLFCTKGLAANYLHQHFQGRSTVTARVYHGATKAWERSE